MTDHTTLPLSVERTYSLLRNALFTLLLSRPFEKISLTDICRHAMIPRSTFYRYFSDKYDLLNHSFDTFALEINLGLDIRIIENRAMAEEFFLRLLSFLQKNKATYRRLMISHRQDSVFDSLESYLDIKLYDSLLLYSTDHVPDNPPSHMITKITAGYIISAGKAYLESDKDLDIRCMAYKLSLCANEGLLYTSRPPEP